MARTIELIKEMLDEVNRESNILQIQLERAEEEIRRLKAELIRQEQERMEDRKDLENKEVAIDRLLKENWAQRERLKAAGLDDMQIREADMAQGVYCMTCDELLIGREIGKRYCDRCYRLYKQERGEWFSGGFKTAEEREKEKRPRAKRKKEEELMEYHWL